MILGHGNPTIIRAVQEAAERGLSFGAPTAAEADAIVAAVLKAAPLLPQTLINVRGSRRDGFMEEDGVRAAIDKVEQELGRNGRLLLRPSGTEPLVRVMVEGKDADQVERLCRHLAEAVETAIA